MKKPKLPPRLNKIWDTIKDDSVKTSKIVQALSSPINDVRYHHWDKLGYYSPPDGFSLEEWWLVLKYHRQSKYKPLPLSDLEGSAFHYVQTDPIPEKIHALDQASGGFTKVPTEIINTETKDRYHVGSLIQEAITSSQLEGAATTRIVAKEMIRTGRRPVDNSEQMILNNFTTMHQIEKFKNDPLSPELIFEIHRLVTEHTLDDETAAGRFRKPDERIAVYDNYNEILHAPPPAQQLEERIAALCDFANNKNSTAFVHPVIRSIILHFWLAYDHPFVDGNGRTARSLFYWSMLHYGHWLFEFVSISQVILKAPAKYGRAFLYTETDDNDLTYFILYHLEVIEQAITELNEYIKRKSKRLLAIEQQLQGVTLLNHRQRALISHALRHPLHKYTIESHRICHNVVYETSRRDFLDLQDRGLLVGGKIGKTWYFTPVKDLEKRLTRLP